MSDPLTATTCSVCGRAVWTTDVNAKGQCVGCRRRPVPPPDAAD